MSQEQVLAVEMVGAGAGTGISVPGDSIFDDIFDWISNLIPSILNGIGDNLVKVINAIGDNAQGLVYSVAAGTVSVITAIGNSISQIIGSLWPGIVGVITAVGNTASLVVSSLSTGISSVITAVGNTVSTIVGSVSSGIASVITATANAASQVIGSLSGAITSIIPVIASGFASVTSSISQLVAGISQTVVSTFSALSAQVKADFTWITDWLATGIPKILGTWWDFFLARVFDFGAWIGKLFDAVSSWVTRDIPGHSPWWTSFFESIGSFFKDQVWGFLKYFFSDLGGNIVYGLNTSFKFIGDFFGTVIDGMINSVIGFIANVGPISPDMALTHVSTIGRVAMSSLTALTAMTLSGEVVGWWKHVGLGNISSIFYDMSNYKAITGGLMTSLTDASIKTPLKYYFNYKLRPALPGVRDLLDMFTDEHLTRQELGTYLGYHGIADSWHDKYASIAWRSMSPFQLKTAAQDGSFDEVIFYDELTNGGFRPETKKMLIDSFRKASLNNLRPTSVNSATYRFKNGWTNEAQFMSELKILQVGDAMLPVYLASTRLDYASDYLADLETAYANAVRSGQLGIDEYRQALRALGMVPERVEAKVFIEQARIKPSAALSPVAGSKSYYLTDAGKLILDTTRRRRRKEQLTREQELAEFSKIGIPADLAAAYADNDEVRLKEPATTQGG